MNSTKFINDCKKLISEESEIDIDKIVEVWFCKTLDNFKGLFYNIENKRYYECTFNGIQKCIYLDCYAKQWNKVFIEL